MSETLPVTRSEREAIDSLVHRLHRRFPDFPADVVAEVVARAHSAFSDAKVRDFVPVLVEQDALKELKRAGALPVPQG